MSDESEYETTSDEEESEEETNSEEESGEDEKQEMNVVKPPAEKTSNEKETVKSLEQKVPNKVIEPPKTLSPARASPVSLATNRPLSPYEQPRTMTHARKQNLKSMMLNKAREDLKKEAVLQAEEKKAILNNRIEGLGDTGSMNQQDLMDLCRELHGKIDNVDEQRYDLEARVKKNDSEIEDLNQRIFDLRGKFKRPPLRRVRMSADQMLRALLGSKHKVSMDLRSNLKSVKKEESKKDDGEMKDWRENVEAKTGMGGKKAMFEQEQQQE